jgi:protein transport protein SEC61 subunit gamma-like protein|tara:strand:- start:538 stop:717 length:180 start_codon:yes stop_codon:yes gene_type:complete
MNQTLNDLKSFFFKSKRVWHVLKKPTKEEFVTIAKISAIGILVVGVVGFMISIAMGYIV